MPFDGILPERSITDRVADYLEQHGWCQGAMEKDEARCVIGAFIAVAALDVSDGSIEDNIAKGNAFARRLGFSTYREAIVWNDYVETTREMVISRLRQPVAVEAA